MGFLLRLAESKSQSKLGVCLSINFCFESLIWANLQACCLLHSAVPGVVVGAVEGDVVFVACGFPMVEKFLSARSDWMAELPGFAFDDALNLFSNKERLTRGGE